METRECLVTGYEGSGKTAVLEALKHLNWNFIELPSINRTSDPKTLSSLYLNLCQNISLVLFVMPMGRILEQTIINYQVVRYMIKNTPMILVVTGCENDEDLQRWPTTNRKTLSDRLLVFDEVFGGCFIQGGRFAETCKEAYATTVKDLSAIVTNYGHNKDHISVTCSQQDLVSFVTRQVGTFTDYTNIFKRL